MDYRTERRVAFLSLQITVGESRISVFVDYSEREQHFCLLGLQKGRVVFLSLRTTVGESRISVFVD